MMGSPVAAFMPVIWSRTFISLNLRRIYLFLLWGFGVLGDTAPQRLVDFETKLALFSNVCLGALRDDG